jgi:hypothetical protein
MLIARTDADALELVGLPVPADLAYAVRVAAHADGILLDTWVADAFRAALARAPASGKGIALPRRRTRLEGDGAA